MAKKKAKVEGEIGGYVYIPPPNETLSPEIEINAPHSDERVYKTGGKAEVIDGEWRILYTPQWRAQLEFEGFMASLDFMKREVALRVDAAVGEFYGRRTGDLRLDWQQESDTVWIATGNDGTGETTLPIVRLTRVADIE